MKLTALAVVILALGIVVGFALAGGSSGGPASAVPKCPGPSSQCATPTPAPPQQREDQITIFSDTDQSGITGDWSSSNVFPIVALDRADYPADADFRFEALFLDSDAGTCARLFDLAGDSPVSGSELCLDQATAFFPPTRLRSGILALGVGEREYVAQTRCLTPCLQGGLNAARIIVEWTE